MTILEQLRTRLRYMKKARPFWIGDFYNLGSTRQVQNAFAVCVQTGELKRLARGVYDRPKTSRFLKFAYFGSAIDLAFLSAKQSGAVLVPQGMEAAYWLGLQTQMPMQKVFWSNGSNRIFQIGCEVVLVRQLKTGNNPNSSPKCDTLQFKRLASFLQKPWLAA